MNKLIYLVGDFNDSVEDIVRDKDFQGCGITSKNVARTMRSFYGDKIAASTFLKKYALRDENNKIIEFTLEEAKLRWINAIVEAEKQFPSSKDAIYFKELYEYFLPAGRQMLALGNTNLKKATYTNCYVTKIYEDSIEGIYDADKVCAKTYSYGGGIGLCIGELRPADAKVSNSARFSTGAVSFMPQFSSTTDRIGQQGRRGALMITIPVNHPDIYDFIEIKHNNENNVQFANISIKLTDEFMNAVEKDGDFVLSFETGHETIKKVVKAQDLWNKITTAARDSAEPGLLFWDRAVEMSPSDSYPRLKIHSTNPCVTADTWVHTNQGPKQVIDLIGEGSFVARVDGKNYTATKFFSTGIKSVYKIITEEGYNLRLTENHLLCAVTDLSRYNIKSKWKKLSEILPGDLIMLSNHSSMPNWEGEYTEKEGYLIGSLVGDGNISNQSAKLAVWEKDEGSLGIMLEAKKAIDSFASRADFKGWIPVKDKGEFRMCKASFSKFVQSLGLDTSKTLTPLLEKTSSDFHRGFLRGFFDTDGSVQGNQKKGVSIRLSQSDLERLLVVQRMLLRLGIVSTIYENRRLESTCLMPDGKGGQKLYKTKANHELIISNDNVFRFRDIIGFCHLHKKQKLEDIIKSYNRSPNRERFVVKVKQIVFEKEEEVFDTTVGEIHAFDANGLYAHNCGEQLLEPGGACVLGSLILHKFIINPFTDEAYFDYKLFEEMVKRGVRHLDNIVELNLGKHPLPEQEEASRLGRRIGLGITGLADVFTAMKIKYDSSEALELANKIMETKKIAEYDASIDLAKERGSFPLYNPDIHFTRGFPATLPKWLIDKAKENGLRNVALSTIAPNGTLAIIAQCSSGAEPIFALHYTRNVMLGKEEKKEFSIHHPGIARFFEISGEQDMPDYWVTAHEIDDMYRVKLQGVLQKHIDASISSTINLPKDATVETVRRIYLNAWREGLKGITVYRETSRKGVLITDKNKESVGALDMNTTVHCVRAEGGDKFYLMISYENKDITKPYQVFVMNYKKVESDAFLKISNSLIKMLIDRGIQEERITKYINRSSNSLVKMTRFLSLSMKTGNLSYALKILYEHAFVGTLAGKLHDILIKSVKADMVTCPDCGGANLKSEESCLSCLDCNWSRCH